MSLSPLASVFLQCALLVLLIVVTTLVETPVLLRLKRFTSTTARSAALRTAMVFWWTYAALAVLLSWPANLFLVPQDGIGMAWLSASTAARGTAIIMLLAYFVLALSTGVRCAIKPALRLQCWHALASLRFMLPVSARERRSWVALCITAGVCEEVVFRGFLLQLINGQLSLNWHPGLTVAWLLSSLMFGCGHAYQGAAGIMRTILAGLLFGLMAIMTGSLLWPIVLHILADLAVLWMYRPVQDKPAAAQLLIDGCDPARA